jgi:metal-dependent hydrolase (beta-lactamase superfamily II)
MRISVLRENHAGLYTLAEHGLSDLIEFDGRRILFDTRKKISLPPVA